MGAGELINTLCPLHHYPFPPSPRNNFTSLYSHYTRLTVSLASLTIVNDLTSCFFYQIPLVKMKFAIAITALASLAGAAVINGRQDTTQNFEFQSFAAACEAGSDQCT